MKFLLTLLFSVCLVSAFCQYLPPRLQSKTVYMKMTHSGKYVTGVSSNLYQYDKQSGYAMQSFELQSSSQANWYYIYDVTAGQYVTVNAGLTDVYTAAKFTNGTDLAYQTFQFVAQTQTDRFKIHTRFNSGSVDYVLQITAGITGNGADLKIGTNLSSNDDHQKFDLADLNPPAAPGSGIAALSDRFKNRTSGIISKQFDQPVQGINATNEIKVQASYFSNWNKEFKIEGTSETGWFKIRCKRNSKYVTVLAPFDGELVQLRDDAAYDDDRQKFKFVLQGNDSTYKIHSKYSVGALGFVAYVLGVDASDNNSQFFLQENNTVSADAYQQFKLSLYQAPAAEFTSGSTTNAGGKIQGRQYYFSSFESLALLEPYISGTDTFVRIQASPVYNAQSEWTVDPGVKQGGIQYYRIRYDKTGQYLYMPTSSENAVPVNGMLFKLKAMNTYTGDKRFEFDFRQQGNIQHTFFMVAHAPDSTRRATIDDEGNLVVMLHDNGVTYVKNEEFIINLTYPSDSTLLYSLDTHNQGHFLSDSGIKSNLSPIIHRQYSDFSCMWRFIPAGNNQYYIRNALTGLYLSSNYSNAYNARVYDKPTNSTAYEKWLINRDGNYYTFKNVGSNQYLALMNHPDPEAYVYQGTIGSAGYYWIVTKNDFYTQGLATPVPSTSLLQAYNPLATNALNDEESFNRLMQCIGFPFNPSYYRTTNGFSTQIDQDLINYSFTPYPSVDLKPAIRAALAYKFNWNSAQVDSALRNFHPAITGHRVDVAVAVKAYVLENLALRNRTTWSYAEKQMVGFLETTIEGMKQNYGERIQETWEHFWQNKIDDALPFSVLYFDVIADYNAYKFPTYIQPNESESLSFMEYAGYCAYKQYKNPPKLTTTYIPGTAVPGAMGFISGIVFQTSIKSAQSAARAAASALEAIAERGSELAAVRLGYLIKAADLGKLLGEVGGAGISTVVTVVMFAAEMLATVVMNDIQFDKFKTRIKDRYTYLDTVQIDVNRIMANNNLLDQFGVDYDLDYILGKGKRFDSLNLDDSPIFVGTGNWSEGSNWSTYHPPLSTISFPTTVLIYPLEGGECVLDVPVTVQPGGIINVSRGKTFKVNAQLTVPDMNVIGQ